MNGEKYNMEMAVDSNILAMDQCEAGVCISEKSPVETATSFGTKQSFLRSKWSIVSNPGSHEFPIDYFILD